MTSNTSWRSLIGLLVGVAALVVAVAIVLAATRPELVERRDPCALR